MRIAIAGGQLLLLLVTAFFFALGVNALVAAELVRSVPPVHLPPELRSADQDTEAREAAANVLLYNRNLFNADDEGTEAATSEPSLTGGESGGDDAPTTEAAPEVKGESDLPFTLIGTMVAEPNELSVAYLRDDKTQDEVFARRGTKLDDALLVYVARTFVVVERDGGELETIGLRGADGPSLPPALEDRLEARAEAREEAEARELARQEREAEAEANGEPVVEDGLVQVDEESMHEQGNRIVVQRDDAIAQLEHAEEALEHLGLTPIAEGGAPMGMRLGAVEGETLFEAMGLQEGDVIISVQGRPVREAEDVVGLLKALANDGQTAIEIDRRGTRDTIELRAE